MSIPIPTRKTSEFELDERQWLRRLRGSSLGQLADMANQLAFRKGLNCISKSWSYGFSRDDKSGDGGYPFFSSDMFQTQDYDYYVDIPYTHLSASHIGVILTYLAPNDLENDLDPFQTAGQSEIKMKITDLSGSTSYDPPPGSSQSWAVIMSGAEMPSPRVLYSSEQAFEALVNNFLNLSQGDGEYGYSARVLRSALYLDRGTLGVYTAPRRMGYHNAPSSVTRTLQIRASYAVLLDAMVFEIPKLIV